MAVSLASRFTDRLRAIGGETGRLMADHDWSASPLGPPEAWPQSLRSVVVLLLGSKVPMFVAWGDDLGFLYNDAYSEILGTKHPAALGAPFQHIWSEIWPDISPLIDAALAGEATYHEDLPLIMNRRGYDEQTWFTFSYSPVQDENGVVAGMYCACAETTGKVLAEQRQSFVVSLGDALAKLTDPVAMMALTAELLGRELRVGRAGYGEMDATGEIVLVARDWTDGAMMSLAGEARVLDAFGPDLIVELRAGRTLVVEDCFSDPRTSRADYLATWDSIGARALIVAPLVADGRLFAFLYVHSAVPRRWSDLETRLVEDAGSRTWAAVERTYAEAALRESEARQAFLLSLSDMLRTLKTPGEIGMAAAQRLGERFGLNRVFYAEFFGSLMKVDGDYTNGVDSIVGEHDLAAFGPDLLRCYHDRPVVKVDDVRTDARFSDQARAGLLGRQVGAYLDVVLFQNDTWVSVLALQSAGPRIWTASEEGLFREVGERIKAAIERLRAEDQLRELNDTLERRVEAATAERNMLATLVEMTDVMIMAIDLDYNILALNAAIATEIERVYGVRPKAGDNMLALLDHLPEHREQVRVGWAHGMRGEKVTIIGDYGDPARDRPFYEVTFRPLCNDAGEQIGVYQFVIDVTDRLRRDAQLAEAQDALRQSQKMEAMGQLTGGVAHDFNNLLTPIVGALDILQRKQLGGAREQRLIAGAIQSAERAKTLVQRLLAFARRQPLQPIPVDLATLVNDMAELVASTTGPQIKVLADAPAGLPPAKADPNQLEMALLNLAVNARDAMADGGGTLRITVRAEDVRAGHRSHLRPGAYLCLSVADTGAGMDEATIARAVEPFFSTKGVGKGTGLGLSMVHGLASQLDGALTIQSRPGLGANIELWLPQSAEEPEAARPAPDASELPELRGTALLVDDEDLVRLSTADMLNDLGYAVIEAASAEEAMHLVKAGARFDLIVTDHLMPGLTGAELAREVRSVKPGVPVLLVSGYAEGQGLDPQLPRLWKPFRVEELASSLAQLTQVG